MFYRVGSIFEVRLSCVAHCRKRTWFQGVINADTQIDYTLLINCLLPDGFAALNSWVTFVFVQFCQCIWDKNRI